MEVKIGVQQAPRELVIDTDQDAEQLSALVTDALGSGGVLDLSDTKGRRTIVPVEKIAYVEIGTGVAGHVGFRS